MAIAQQPAMAPAPIPARAPAPTANRPVLAYRPHELVAVDRPARGWTVAKIVGLVAVTALGVALCTAVVLGTALFTLLNLAG